MDIEQLYNDLIEGNILSIIAEPYAFSKIKREVLDNDDTQVWDVVNIPKSNIFSNNVNSGNYSMMVLNQEYDLNPDYTNIFDFLTTIFYTNDSMSQDFYFNISLWLPVDTSNKTRLLSTYLYTSTQSGSI